MTRSIMSRQHVWKHEASPSRTECTTWKGNLGWRRLVQNQVGFEEALAPIYVTVNQALTEHIDNVSGSAGGAVARRQEAHPKGDAERAAKLGGFIHYEDRYHVIASVDGGLYTEW